MSPRALLDTNILVASLFEAHSHYAESFALFSNAASKEFAVSAHSLAEAYSTLTRGGQAGPFGFTPREAFSAIERIRLHVEIVGLTAAQIFDGIRQYAFSGGIGPRLYDKLIGEAAIASGARAIVTWNVRHMRGLFPDLLVATPSALY